MVLIELLKSALNAYVRVKFKEQFNYFLFKKALKYIKGFFILLNL